VTSNDYLGFEQQKTPAHLFGVVCPQVMRARRAALEVLGGRYGFNLLGEGGGQWTLDFRTAEVRTGVADGADITLELDAKDFERLMSDRLKVADAVAAGRIRWSGRTELLTNLKFAFLPA
jgi:hypothetical protein